MTSYIPKFNSPVDLFNFIDKKGKNTIAFRWYDNNKNTIITKTYHDYCEDITKFINLYSEKNFKKKNIGIVAENSYHYAVNSFGIILMGGVVIPLNQNDSNEILYEEIEFSNIEHIFSDHSKEITNKNVCVYEINEYEQNKNNDIDFVSVSSSDIVAMVFTSGTTGKSKCAMFSWLNIDAAIYASSNYFVDAEKTTNKKASSLISILPFYHVFGFIDMFVFLGTQKQQNLCTNIKHLRRDIQIFDNDFACAVPILLDGWAKELSRNEKALGNIHSILYGGSTSSFETVKTLLEKNMCLIHAYGMTETTTIGLFCIMDKNSRHNLLGKPVKTMNVKIIDNEICLSGPCVFSGYYKNEHDNDVEVKDGWLHTGDLGFMDDEGNVYMIGRKKNLIILESGENVSPEELEERIRKCDLVKEVVVVEKNKKICSVIYCDKEDQDKIKEHINNVNMNNPLYKRISIIEFTDKPLDKTTTGKIKRN